MNSPAKKQKEAPVSAHLRDLAEKMPALLTIQEAAELLRVHERTMRRIVADKELTVIRSKESGSARVIIPRSEIIRWLEARSAR